ncbi:hypothetical protein [Maritimibacter sp. 55A14]|uniref:hypothetical protein n=1 Tax=Maritimibacter sp. 55A14 TaxID=2174844 RepID=UPI0018EE4A8C|nr:hypothetical protein [Maritimibacter sp. 55A14]
MILPLGGERTGAENSVLPARSEAKGALMGSKNKSTARSHGGKHWVQLPEWVLRTEAWRHLSVGARALYIELKRRYKGKNNGAITLSHREAAHLLGLHRNSVGKLYRELQDKGFIRMMEAAYLGPSGIGKTARWALDEYSTDTDYKPPLRRFKEWYPEQNPPNSKKDAPSQTG